MRITPAPVLAILAFAAPAAAQTLGLNVSGTGSFTISMDGHPWLSGGEVMVGSYSASSGDLVLVGSPATSSGTDALGGYNSMGLKWAHKDAASEILMVTNFRTYASDPGAIVFEQSFPAELSDFGDESLFFKPGATDGECRITTTSKFKVTKSKDHFDAYLPSSSGFDEHKDAYCGEGSQTHAPTVFDGVTDLKSCQDKCTQMKCTCFDYKSGGQPHPPGPSPKPGSLSAKTVFPGFSKTGPASGFSCFSYHGVFPHMEKCTVSSYAESHQGGAPLTIYDKSNASLPMVVFSPLNWPKAHHMAHSNSFFGAGVKSTVETIPAGWSQLFLLSAGVGINEGMMAWGDRMLKFTGKPRADKYYDQTHSTIGFWTDNGGYYHYSTGDKSVGKNYEEVLPKVKAYHDAIGVPFGHWQFDSWFYPKDGAVGAGGGGGAVTNWTAMDKVFPHGMAYIQSKLKVPMVMHNRQWSDKSDYIKHNAGGCEWYTNKFAIPHDPAKFFTWFFQQQQGWGLSMYEQDWMCTEYDGVSEMQKNITLGDLWLKGMAEGAGSPGSNRTVQYCMPYPNDLLSASAYKEVTNARATGDYFHAGNQWAVGATSLFYWAIGILPFKDGFYSSTHTQNGGQTKGPEKNPDREALMATLSCAMVGPMDGINLLNASRTMTTCRGDGVVLKPDKPVSTSDACFRAAMDDPGCFVYTTHSDHSYSSASAAADATTGRTFYYFDNDAKTKLSLDVLMAGEEPSVQYYVYNWYTAEVAKLGSDGATLSSGYEGHNYAVVSPAVGTDGAYAFVGEVDKYVTASKMRFPAGVQLAEESSSAAALTVQVAGVANETVKVCAIKTAGPSLECTSLHFDEAGTKPASFPPSSPY